MFKPSFIGALCVIVATSTAAAQVRGPAQDDGPRRAPSKRGTFYVGVGLGAGAVTEAGVRESVVDLDGQPFVLEGTLDYDAGFAGSLVVGYNLSDYFAVEGEATGRSNDFAGNIGDSDFAVSTLMAGVVAKLPTGVIEPYVGASAGLVANNFEGGDNAFGYQLKGGVRFPFRRSHAFGAEVSYVFTDGFDVDDGFSDPLQIDYEHVAYMLTYRFQSTGY